MNLRLKKYSYRFAEQVLNSNLPIKQEIENVLLDRTIDISTLTRPLFNKTLDELFIIKGWESQPPVFDEPGDPSARMDFFYSTLVPNLMERSLTRLRNVCWGWVSG